MQILIRLITLWIFIITVGCQTSTVDPEAPFDSISTPVVPSAQGDITPMPTFISTPSDAGLQKLIEKARTDLAQRLSVSMEDIILLEATSVTWPDSSLGCAQEGLMYLPALTPGYLIRLAALEREYEYHSDQDSLIVYCVSPSPPLPGILPDR
jgi:hypothetical protein